jgi:hypothetical protein
MSLSSVLAQIATLGHIKPLLALYARIAERRPASALELTLLSSASMLPKIQRELELIPGHLSERIKWVLDAEIPWYGLIIWSVIDVGASATSEAIMGFVLVFEAFWEGKPVVCETTGKEFNLPRPSVAIIDVSSSLLTSILHQLYLSAILRVRSPSYTGDS